MAVEESNTVPLTITLPADVHAELEYLTKLQKQHGAAIPWETVEEMMQEVAVAIADGSRRPGAWERQLLDMIGLTPECEEARHYREQYGEPAE
ncbi:hypothetical protein ACPF7Z_08950 [Halomonas sp. GXIMD04776]|mgnify:CR=1 FL=1|uniref:hypothetical protein n=1 Tax=Halomonas sp. GXIMD04776 TaxID=3415605 RepID=UPI003C889F78